MQELNHLFDCRIVQRKLASDKINYDRYFNTLRQTLYFRNICQSVCPQGQFVNGKVSRLPLAGLWGNITYRCVLKRYIFLCLQLVEPTQ